MGRDDDGDFQTIDSRTRATPILLLLDRPDEEKKYALGRDVAGVLSAHHLPLAGVRPVRALHAVS